MQDKNVYMRIRNNGYSCLISFMVFIFNGHVGLAQNIKLDLYNLTGPNAISSQELNQSFQLARRWLKTTGVNVTLSHSYEQLDPCVQLSALSDFLNHFQCLLGGFRNTLKYRVYNYASAPPLILNSDLYSGGWTVQTCIGAQNIRFSMGYSKHDGIQRDYKSWNAVIMAHELGHALGAYHDYRSYPAGCSIMHPSALGCINLEKPTFSKQSIREIKNCQKRLK